LSSLNKHVFVNNQEFYEQNAQEYFRTSVNVDLSHLYQHFLDHIPQGGRILDAGCGSGRDVKYFKDKKYKVSAFDASAQLAALASKYSDITVDVKKFDEINYMLEFDAVWACASLVHLNKKALTLAIKHLSRACKDGGIIFMSLKATVSEQYDDRTFYKQNIDDIEAIISMQETLSILRHWYTKDTLNREHTIWLNLLLRVSYL
jgi:SAM-dependent methyltransferase